MSTWLVLFIVFDLIAVLVVVWFIVTHRRPRRAPGAPAGLAGVTRFAGEVDGQIRDFVQARYTGEPETLRRVLPDLIGRLEARARAEGLELGRDVIESIITRAITTHGLARARDVSEALEDLRPEVAP